MGNLTDRELKNLKPKTKLYKVTDGEGMSWPAAGFVDTEVRCL